MRILLVPWWLDDAHWMVIGALLWLMTLCAGRLYAHSGQLRSLLYTLALAALAAIATLFWLIQVGSPIDPIVLFTLERILWWPLLADLALLVDIHAAELNGHRSVIARLDRALRNYMDYHGQDHT